MKTWRFKEDRELLEKFLAWLRETYGIGMEDEQLIDAFMKEREPK